MILIRYSLIISCILFIILNEHLTHTYPYTHTYIHAYAYRWTCKDLKKSKHAKVHIILSKKDKLPERVRKLTIWKKDGGILILGYDMFKVCIM